MSVWKKMKKESIYIINKDVNKLKDMKAVDYMKILIGCRIN